MWCEGTLTGLAVRLPVDRRRSPRARRGMSLWPFAQFTGQHGNVILEKVHLLVPAQQFPLQFHNLGDEDRLVDGFAATATADGCCCCCGGSPWGWCLRKETDKMAKCLSFIFNDLSIVSTTLQKFVHLKNAKLCSIYYLELKLRVCLFSLEND